MSARAAAWLPLLLAGTLAWAQPAVLALLGPGPPIGWEERSFAGHTVYTARVVDGVPALRAQARAAASGLYLEREVELARWPQLRWQWRVAASVPAGDARARDGDDFAARVYVIARHPVLFWKTRAVCYVWAHGVPAGEAWPNPFTASVMMVALRSGDREAGRWREERRDVAADFRRLFGDAPEVIDAVAIMTDTDQSGADATAWYAGLRFERPPAP